MLHLSKIYQTNHKQFILQLNNKIDNLVILDILKNNDSFVGLISSNSTIYQISEAGQIKLSHQKDANSSNLVGLSATSVSYYSANKNRIFILNSATFQVQEKEINIQPTSFRNQFQLFHFRSIQMLALVERINDQGKLNIWYLKEQNNQLTLISNQSTEDNQWRVGQTIYKVNDYGLIGWCSTDSGNLSIHLFTVNQGFKALKLQSKIESSKQIGAIVNGSNKLHIALLGQKSDNLPVIVIETSSNYSVIQNERKVNFELEEKFGQIKEIYNLGNFIAFRSTIQGNRKIFVYSLEIENIVESYSFKEQSTLRESLTSKGTLIQTLNQTSTQELSFIVHSIKRQNDLQVMKLLQAHSKINQISATKDKAVIFFGTHGSGKSTYINYLCQKQLQHIYHEDLAYYELLLKEKKEKIMSGTDKLKYLQVQQNKLGALIQIPDWNQSQELKSHIMLLMQTILRSFKSIHFVVTIPYQQIQQAVTYQKIVESVINLIKTSKQGLKDIQLGDYMSVLLTKIEDSEANQIFKDYIELMKEQNEVVGNLLERVNEKQRIILFENKPYDTYEGEEASINLFGSDMLLINETKSQESKNILTLTEESRNLKRSLQLQLNLYSSLVNKLFMYFSNITIQVPSSYILELLEEQNYHLNNQFGKSNLQNQDKIQLLYSYFMAVSELKILLQQKPNQILQEIGNLQKYLEELCKEYQKITIFEECELLRMVSNCFVSSIILLIDYFPDQNSQRFQEAVSSLKNEQHGILGKKFKLTIEKLRQNQLVSNQKSILQGLNKYLGQKSGRPIIRIIKKQLSFEQEREFYLKNKIKILETICSLPANAMKLDLILQQIVDYMGKQKIDNQDIRKVRYYLREASRICHFHQLYVEATILLMVIPDFIGIQVLLDEMVQNCKRKNTIQNKKLLGKEQEEIIDELIVICRQCVRDNLVSKLIYIKSLNKQVNSKQNQIKKHQTISRNKQLSKQEHLEKYQQKLRNKNELIFYNLKNMTFKDLIEKRRGIIEKCINYEKDQNAQKFADIQALNWVIQRTPIPSIV